MAAKKGGRKNRANSSICCSGEPATRSAHIKLRLTMTMPMAAMTNIVGFGSLAMSNYPGLRSVGVISVVGNIIPEEMIRLVSAAASGDLATARQQHHKLFPLCRDLLFLATNPIPIKAAVAMQGRIGPEVRLPLLELSEHHREPLRSILLELDAL